MPPSVDTILARLDALEENTTTSINRVARAVEIQNGRLTKVEMARAEEKGAREAVAQAAAQTAAALVLNSKSRAWKITVGSFIVATAGGVATIAGIVSQLLYHH